MQSKLPGILDKRYSFKEHDVRRVAMFNHTEPADFEDTNDGRGATLFGMMILVVVTGVFWFAVGFAIGQMS